jgi:Cell Wall Hydrolase
MLIADQFLLALTCWRENRGGGYTGMQSVANVIMNRAARRWTSPYVECVRPLQFSSITAKGDPELTLWPEPSDASWIQAQEIAGYAAGGTLADITGGATLYYAPHSIETNASITLPNGTSIPFPKDWNESAVTYTATIQGQVFFR